MIAIILVVAVVAILTSPWSRLGIRVPGTSGTSESASERTAVYNEILELRAARDAKYREIQDAELDRQTGKLSKADFSAVDSGLRSEAIELLKALDKAEARLRKLQGDSETPDGDQADLDAHAGDRADAD
ncbi:MAG: hypothetical protein J2O48_01545 [Solirubrobacterales bacterium]|nr:hypothetical protein [Solirubrobacterales bacterium]